MVSSLRHHDRLDALAADIHRLRVEVIARERESGDLLDGEDAAALANDQASAARILLEAAKDRYFDESEVRRASECPIHGDAILVSCPGCAVRNPTIRKNHEIYLEVVRTAETAAE